jgi:hypothetical protein
VLIAHRLLFLSATVRVAKSSTSPVCFSSDGRSPLPHRWRVIDLFRLASQQRDSLAMRLRLGASRYHILLHGTSNGTAYGKWLGGLSSKRRHTAYRPPRLQLMQPFDAFAGTLCLGPASHPSLCFSKSPFAPCNSITYKITVAVVRFVCLCLSTTLMRS